MLAVSGHFMDLDATGDTARPDQAFEHFLATIDRV